MLSIPGHPFIRKTIREVFSSKMLEYGKDMDYESTYMRKHFCVMNTTGPWVLMDLYGELTDEE